MSELYLKAYIPSVQEYKFYFNKFKAFMNAKLSKKAKENGAWLNNDYDAGYYFLRTFFSGSSFLVYYGGDNGARTWPHSDNKDAGLRVAFQLIYDSENSLVKDCKMKTQMSSVWDRESQKDIYVESEAPIILFDGKECIWLNKEECESGKDKTMKLWTLELVDCAKPFYVEGKEEPHNNFGQAKELQDQCLTIFSKEAQDLLVTVKMSKEDGYEKTEPILDKSLNEKQASRTISAKDRIF